MFFYLSTSLVLTPGGSNNPITCFQGRFVIFKESWCNKSHLQDKLNQHQSLLMACSLSGRQRSHAVHLSGKRQKQVLGGCTRHSPTLILMEITKEEEGRKEIIVQLITSEGSIYVKIYCGGRSSQALLFNIPYRPLKVVHYYYTR